MRRQTFLVRGDARLHQADRLTRCAQTRSPGAGSAGLHALIGGVRLVPPLSDDYVRQTVADLKALKPDHSVAAHCSGEPFCDIAGAEMPGRVIQANVGSRFSFGTRA